MAKTITVKGIGRVTARPDYVVLSMALETKDMDYGKAMSGAALHLEDLDWALTGVGFGKDDLKTTNFIVDTSYTNVKKPSGEFERVFDGYAVRHNLRLAFDFDMARLAETLAAVTGCLSNPDLSVSFTVKDPSSINREMLRSAAANAREKAEVLCQAAGVRLGELLAINYNWEELNIVSNTRYAMAEDCLAVPGMVKSMNIRPDDIDVSDTAAFMWAIE